MSLLRFDQVTLVRGGRELFAGLDLVLERGAALRLLGPNGCGKSSLLRLAAGLLTPAQGLVERGSALALADDRLALDPELPLRRSLAFWGGPRLDEAVRAFALERLAHVPVRLLSTGQARRARLARVMVSNAPVWLLDEPLNGLDMDGERRLAEAIAIHRAAGGAVLAASHQPLSGDWRELELGR